MANLVLADDGGDSIATELYPGWNLIGWVGQAAPVGELFEVISPLDLVGSYDLASASWTETAREERSQSPLILRPGRAYWLRLAGPESFTWIRERGAYNNDVQLREGNNFVAWRALDRVPAASGLRQIRHSVVMAGSWDAASQRWRLAPVPLPFSSWSLAEFNHGEGLWIKASEDTTWRQLTGERPSVSFVGEVTEQQRVEALAELEAYRELFATTFGGVVSGTHVVVFSDIDANLEWSRAVWGTGRARESCGFARSWDIYYTIACGDKSILAHEYFHVLQSAASDWGGLALAPLWITEGEAMYAQRLAASRVEGLEFAELMRSGWQRSQADGRGLSSATDVYDHHQYETGAAAIHLLLQTNAAEELLLYVRRLSEAPAGEHYLASGGDPYSRAVFTEQFGISIPDLDALLGIATPEFGPPLKRAVRLQTQEPPLRLQVQLESPDGSRYDGTAVIRFLAPDPGQHFTELAIGGSSSIPVVAGRYEVQSVDVGGGCQVGFDAPEILVEDKLVDSVWTVRLEATGCDAGVSGTVLGRDGQPLQPRARGVWVELFPESDDGFHWSQATQVVPDAQGRFEANVAPDRYAIAVSPIESGGAVFGWLTEAGLSLVRAHRTILDLRTDSTQEVTIRLPISRTIRVSGVVYDGNGRPAENLTIFVEGSSEGYLRPGSEGMSRGYIGWIQRTDSGGGFDIPFAGQDVVVVLFTEDNCHLGWFGPDGFTNDLSGLSYWDTQDRDIRGLSIHLPPSTCE
ncbi:MAG: hypothetical protein F4Y35_03650 [Chloroflexi bacterium]|nr:hypothetical protein [Chloroflexota bacterium]